MSKYYVTQRVERCIGCRACEAHCKDKNNSAQNAYYCKIMEVGPKIKNGMPVSDYVYMACFHCENPWCVEACPTGALTDPYVLDARRCLSYLTIEQPGPIPDEAVPYLGETVAGCDRCQAVCPLNRSSSIEGHPDFRPRPPLAAPSLGDVLFWNDSIFASLTRRSALARCGRASLQRNALAAAAARGDSALLARYLEHGADLSLNAFARKLLRKR